MVIFIIFINESYSQGYFRYLKNQLDDMEINYSNYTYCIPVVIPSFSNHSNNLLQES